jgi:hypothetical protein
MAKNVLDVETLFDLFKKGFPKDSGVIEVFINFCLSMGIKINLNEEAIVQKEECWKAVLNDQEKDVKQLEIKLGKRRYDLAGTNKEISFLSDLRDLLRPIKSLGIPEEDPF